MIEDSVLELSEEILSFKTVSRFAVFEPKRNEPKVEQVGSVLIIQKSKAIILNVRKKSSLLLFCIDPFN
jgi:hypothetical protein